jgi:hypothetical protein
MYFTSYRTRLHPKPPTSELEFGISPKSDPRRRGTELTIASPTQVSSSVSVACSSVPRPSSSSTTRLIELDHPGLP